MHFKKKNAHSAARFSHTAEYYAKYRPNYPLAMLELLEAEGGLTPGSIVADIGSGTGIFAKLLLDRQYKVFGVEPNKEMREKAKRQLSYNPHFVSVNAAAEATGLSDQSVDCVTAATAFHWFDQEKAKREFNRILKPNGLCMLVWNVRMTEASPLMEKYEALLQQYGLDYKEIAAHKVQEQKIKQFFYPTAVKMASFFHHQRLDKNGFLGRLLSVSYLPQAGYPRYAEMIQAAEDLFNEYQIDGWVEFVYSAIGYYGRFKRSHFE